MMDALKGGIKLKSAASREVKPEVAKKDEKPSSVAEILARRIAIVGDSDEEEEDNNGDWSD
jgi:hypothetical protein